MSSLPCIEGSKSADRTRPNDDRLLLLLSVVLHVFVKKQKDEGVKRIELDDPHTLLQPNAQSWMFVSKPTPAIIIDRYTPFQKSINGPDEIPCCRTHTINSTLFLQNWTVNRISNA